VADFADVNKSSLVHSLSFTALITMNYNFEAFKLKTQLENLTKVPSLDNANLLLSQIQQMKHENFQIIQDVFLTSLLTLTDDAAGL
jgi:hypothetical protein